MDNRHGGHEHAHQPSGQQNNVSSSTSPTDLVLGNHLNGPDQVNSSPLVFLEQHRIQLDRVLQTHYEKVRLSLHRQISLQNATLSTIVDSMIADALKEKDEEITRLHVALNQLQDLIRNLEQTIHDSFCFAGQSILYLNWLLAKMDNAGLSGSSHEIDHTDSSQEVNMGMAAMKRTEPSLVCKLCNSHSACMLILPCQHLCACKSCGTHLTTCPICNSPKHGLLEAHFG